MDKKDLTKGTRIYFNGDMANEEGLGVITRQITDRFGTVVDIRMDDKRFFPSISVTAFSDKYLGHGGTRFVTEEAYRDFRQDQIDKVEASLAQKDAERSVSGDELDEKLEDEIDDALVPKYAIQPLRTAVLIKFAEGEIDVKELARAELRDRGVAFVQDPNDELDKMLVEASREAEKRGEPETRTYHVRYTLNGSEHIFEVDRASYTKEAFNKAERFLEKAGCPSAIILTIVEMDDEPPLARVKKEKGSKSMDSLQALRLGLEYGAKLATEKQLAEKKAGYSGEFHCGRARTYKEVAEDLGRIIKEIEKGRS